MSISFRTPLTKRSGEAIVSLRFIKLYGTTTYQTNTLRPHCWIGHSRGILNGIHVAMAYNGTTRKLTNMFH